MKKLRGQQGLLRLFSVKTSLLPKDRIDQFWVSAPIAPAIIDYWVLGTPADASDHKGIVYKLDLGKVDTSLNWQYH